MKSALLVLFLHVVVPGFSQGRSQVLQMRDKLVKTDSTFSIEIVKPGKNKYDFFADSVTPIYEQTRTLVLKLGRNPKTPIVESSVLNQLAQIACDGIRSITTSKLKTRRRVNKKLKRIFFGTACSFGLINYLSFDINLLNIKGKFYYDKLGPEGGFNLYKGEFKEAPTEENPEPVQKPVDQYTTQEISAQISRKLNSWGVASSLRGKEIVAVGIYAIPLKKTFYRARTPKARIMIIFGTKRFHLLLKDRKWKKKHPVSS